jgi:sporulation-control protein spo0M
MIPVTFRIEVPRGKQDSVDMVLAGEMPFVPSAGMWIVAAKDDDYREVESVYWSADEGVGIYFEFDERARAAEMRKVGWTVGTINPLAPNAASDHYRK